MLRYALLGLLALFISACSNPLSFGPGRVDINLVDVAVLSVDHETLFPGHRKDPATPATREALRLVISSQTELLNYFKEWDRQVQVRCAVDVADNGRSYSSFALGPLPENQAVENPTNSPQPYRYTIYAFIDLAANRS